MKRSDWPPISLKVTREQASELITVLNRYAVEKPRAYALKVGALAALGYIYLFGILGFLLVSLVVVVWLLIKHPNAGTIKLALFWSVLSVGVSYAILKSLWVKLEPPEGSEVTAQEAPALFAMIESLRQRLQAPKFHHVRINGDFNASACQNPRLGILGWHRNYLTFGLPLMQALAPRELEAVVAHELGHLSGNHGKFGAWIYRLRRTWAGLFEQLQRQQQGGALFNKFINWYWPYFDAYSFVLARAQEYEADRCAAETSGADALARALGQLELRGRFLAEQYWPRFYKSVESNPNVSGKPFLQLRQALREMLPDDKQKNWYHEALISQTADGDTHPSFRDRLVALGFKDSTGENNPLVAPPNPPAQTAAEVYLGDLEHTLRERLDEDWHREAGPALEARAQELQAKNKALAELRQRASASASPLSAEQRWAEIELVLETDGPEAAVPTLRAFVESERNHAAAHAVLGQILLNQKDAAGISYLERFVELIPFQGLNALQAIHDYFQSTGENLKAREILNRMDVLEAQIGAAARERDVFKRADQFIHHGLTVEELSKLIVQFQKYPKVKKIWMARKVLTKFPEVPLFIVVVKFKGLFPDLFAGKIQTQMAQEITFPSSALVVHYDSELKWVAKKIAKVESSEVFPPPS